MAHWITDEDGQHLYIGGGGKVLATRSAISKASGGTERGKSLASRSKAAIGKASAKPAAKPKPSGTGTGGDGPVKAGPQALRDMYAAKSRHASLQGKLNDGDKGVTKEHVAQAREDLRVSRVELLRTKLHQEKQQVEKTASSAPQPPARAATPGVAGKPSLPPREERPGYKATFGTRGGQTMNRGLHAEELRGARQIMVNRGRHDYSKLVPSFKPQAKAAATEAKAAALEKQATQDYGRNPKLAEAGFSAAKKLRAEAKGRDPQLFSGPAKQAEKGDRATRLADARENVKVRAANRAYALAKEQGVPVAERVRGSEYRNLRADVLKSGRAALARATPDAAKRIEAGKALAEKRLPDRFPLFLKNPATSQPRPAATPAPARPSLREQAAAAAPKGMPRAHAEDLAARLKATGQFSKVDVDEFGFGSGHFHVNAYKVNSASGNRNLTSFRANVTDKELKAKLSEAKAAAKREDAGSFRRRAAERNAGK